MTEDEVKKLIRQKAREMFGREAPDVVVERVYINGMGDGFISDSLIDGLIENRLHTIQIGYNWGAGVIK